jgi:hypothetical protein
MSNRESPAGSACYHLLLLATKTTASSHCHGHCLYYTSLEGPILVSELLSFVFYVPSSPRCAIRISSLSFTDRFTSQVNTVPSQALLSMANLQPNLHVWINTMSMESATMLIYNTLLSLGDWTHHLVLFNHGVEPTSTIVSTVHPEFIVGWDTQGDSDFASSFHVDNLSIPEYSDLDLDSGTFRFLLLKHVDFFVGAPCIPVQEKFRCPWGTRNANVEVYIYSVPII